MRAAGAGAGAACALAVAAVWSARRALLLVRVAGGSMAPTYADGDRLLVRRTARVRRGAAVVFRNPVTADPPLLVKRVAALPGDPVPAEVRAAVGAGAGAVVPPGRVVVRGDAGRSQDSRHFGYVPAGSVVGVVVRRW